MFSRSGSRTDSSTSTQGGRIASPTRRSRWRSGPPRSPCDYAESARRRELDRGRSNAVQPARSTGCWRASPGLTSARMPGQQLARRQAEMARLQAERIRVRRYGTRPSRVRRAPARDIGHRVPGVRTDRLSLLGASTLSCASRLGDSREYRFDSCAKLTNFFYLCCSKAVIVILLSDSLTTIDLS